MVVPKKLGSPWIRPRTIFPNVLMGFSSERPCKCTCQSYEAVEGRDGTIRKSVGEFL